jgi:hypothetical protein
VVEDIGGFLNAEGGAGEMSAWESESRAGTMDAPHFGEHVILR